MWLTLVQLPQHCLGYLEFDSLVTSTRALKTFYGDDISGSTVIGPSKPFVQGQLLGL